MGSAAVTPDAQTSDTTIPQVRCAIDHPPRCCPKPRPLPRLQVPLTRVTAGLTPGHPRGQSSRTLQARSTATGSIVLIRKLLDFLTKGVQELLYASPLIQKWGNDRLLFDGMSSGRL